MSTLPSQILVDGNCIVCDLEVQHYKRVAPAEFVLVDISAPDFDASRFGLTPEAVNRHLHAIAPDGSLHVGVDAFLHIWSRIPRYRFLNRLVGLPGVYALARAGYAVFVVIRPWLPKRRPT